MNDTICRQEAIDAFDCTNELIVGGEANAQNVVNYINKVIGKIKDLPSAQPDQDREFIKLTVRNSNGRPYYSIIYLEVDDNGVGRDFEGYSSYSLDVISDYLKKYFMPSALPETCEGCKHLGKWENEFEYGYPSPCTRCKRRVEDHYER